MGRNERMYSLVQYLFPASQSREGKDGKKRERKEDAEPPKMGEKGGKDFVSDG